MSASVLFTNDVASAIDNVCAESAVSPQQVFVFTDTNADRLVLPAVSSRFLANAHKIVMSAGEVNKNLDTLQKVWIELERGGATRSALLINVGGGVVTDLGGFAASTFKRGIKFINCPTTLLSAVDASVGGKTGIDFNGLKNEIGVIRNAFRVVISTKFFSTLPHSEVLSGYAEMLKHALLSSAADFRALSALDVCHVAPGEILPLVESSVKIKQRFVQADQFETGIRKALNLGHTVGHAFEDFALQRNSPVPHGYAVAWGLLAELILSHMICRFPSQHLYSLAEVINGCYGAFRFTCNDYDTLLQFMRHDKKSLHGEINCTLLTDIAQPSINNAVSPDDMRAALDIFRDMTHC